MSRYREKQCIAAMTGYRVFNMGGCHGRYTLIFHILGHKSTFTLLFYVKINTGTKRTQTLNFSN